MPAETLHPLHPSAHRGGAILAFAVVLSAALSASPAAAAPHQQIAAERDTTLHVTNAVSGVAVAADAGMGIGVTAAGDVGLRALGSRTGIQVEAEYYGIEARARNGTALRAFGTSTGVMAEGGWAGISAGGPQAGVIAAAFEPGGVALKATVDATGGIGVWGEAGRHGERGTGAAVTGYAVGDGMTALSGIAPGAGGVAVEGHAPGADGFAGVFHGDVLLSGGCAPCVPLDTARASARAPGDPLATVLALRPRVFEDSTGTRLGFLADETRRAAPDLVRPRQILPPRSAIEQWNQHARDPESLALLSQGDLVVLLVGALQAQQARIDTLEARLLRLAVPPRPSR